MTYTSTDGGSAWDTNKYIFPIYNKVKAGRIRKYPYVIAYFAADSDAAKFQTYLEEKMENNGKVGCNKVLWYVDDKDYELANGFTPVDVEDHKVFLGAANPAIFVTMQIPSVKENTSFLDMLTANPNMLSAGGDALTRVIRDIDTPVNIGLTAPNFAPEVPGTGA